MTLEDFTKQLKADEMWLEAMRNPSRGKSLPDAIAKVYGQCVSDGTLKQKPIGEHRKHVFNVLGTMKFGVMTGVQLQQEPVKEQTEEEKVIESVDYETHQKRLNEWLASIASVEDRKRVPKMSNTEIELLGQVRPNKQTYISDPSYVHENAKLLYESRVKTVKERHPEFSDEDVKIYIMQKFSAI
jgi:hypothetical protein